MHLGIALTPRSPDALTAYAADVSTPGALDFGRTLTPSQFRARFGPAPAAVRAIERSLRAEGFHLGALSANGLLLHVSAPAATVDAALRVTVRSYALAAGGRGWAASSAPMLPLAVSSHVTAILGLDQLVSVRPLLSRSSRSVTRRAGERAVRPRAAGNTGGGAGGPQPCAAATTATRGLGGWTDDQIAHAYGLDGLYQAGDLGQGETIAIFELEPYLTSDIATFDRCYFGRSRTGGITDVPADGGVGSGSGEGEAVLDIENISALAPDAHMIVYEGGQNNFGNIYASTDEYNAIVSQDRANIISTSWGLCESALDTYAPGTREVEELPVRGSCRPRPDRLRRRRRRRLGRLRLRHVNALAAGSFGGRPGQPAIRDRRRRYDASDRLAASVRDRLERRGQRRRRRRRHLGYVGKPRVAGLRGGQGCG